MDKYWEILSDNLGKETLFNVSEEFFIIDSKSLGSVKTKLYGYSVQKTGIYENDNLTPEGIHGMDGRLWLLCICGS